MARCIATAALLSTALPCTRQPASMFEWPYVASEQAHTKFSDADEIRAVSVGERGIVSNLCESDDQPRAVGRAPGLNRADLLGLIGVDARTKESREAISMDQVSLATGQSVRTFPGILRVDGVSLRSVASRLPPRPGMHRASLPVLGPFGVACRLGLPFRLCRLKDRRVLQRPSPRS